MTDLGRSSKPDGAPGAAPDRGPPPRMPRWVKWPAVIVGVLILLFLVLRFTGLAGEHGPGRHLPGGDVPPASVPADDHTPRGGHG